MAPNPNKLSQFYLMIHKKHAHPTLLEAFRYDRPGKYISIILVLAFLNTLGGCFYYKVVTNDDPCPEAISIQKEEEKFFILHFENQAWKFSDIRTSDDSITGSITPLQGHEYYKTTKSKGATRYKASKVPEKDEREVLNEVHITISEYKADEGHEISISLEDIESIEIYNKAPGITFATWIFGLLILPAALFFGTMGILVSGMSG